MMNQGTNEQRRDIHSQDNLTLCDANYFEACWCRLNSTEPALCPYLLRHVESASNSSYFCVYHTIRKTIECFNRSFIYPKTEFISLIYIYLTIFLFIIGLIGNGLSILILLNKTLRHLSVYRNLTILCTLNIFYLSAILIRHRNNYNEDLRGRSPHICRLHTFIVAFTGHLCSWQLVSTSIQRVHALLSLQAHRQTSWSRTLSILFLCIILPLFVFDGQLLFNYGLFYNDRMCEENLSFESKQFQRALHLPMENLNHLSTIPIRYYTTFFQIRPTKPVKCKICILWNILDTFVYAIIPFLIILISSIIIILKICERRRSTISFGGMRHGNQRRIAMQDNLSILLILINCLFLLMTGPLNICLIIQAILQHFSMKFFFQLNQYLRSLQNSYHALSFVFYCVIGNKFRKSASTMARKIYCKLFPVINGYSPNRRVTNSTSTNDNVKRWSINLIKRQSCVSTSISNQKRRKTWNTDV